MEHQPSPYPRASSGSLESTKLSAPLLLLLNLLLLQPMAVMAQNPPCYLCFDGGVSQITQPDVVVPFPPEVVALLPGGDLQSATCEQIRVMAEDLAQIPSAFCDRNDLKLTSGCPNAIPTTAPATPVGTAPTPPVVVMTAVPVPVPISAPVAVTSPRSLL